MSVSTQHPPELTIATPTVLGGHDRPLTLDSTLKDLPLYSCPVDIQILGRDLAQVFENNPDLPGVTLFDRGNWVGMLSRSRFLEYLLRPQGGKMFLSKSLKVLYSYARTTCLTLSGDTQILLAAQQVLRRSQILGSEPIVVQLDEDTYSLLESHQLNSAYWQIRGIEMQVWQERMQVQMIRSDKMASLGRLVDGVAHEILDPVSFIWGNLSHLSGYVKDVYSLLEAYEKAMPTPPPHIAALREEIEIDYLREDIPKTLESIRTGADRLSKLASSLQNFCHIDEVYPTPANLHDCLDGVLLLLKSRLKNELTIVKHYGHLPPVPCFIGQITQVFLNLLSQGIERLLVRAVAETWQTESLNIYGKTLTPVDSCITVTTETCSLDGSGTRWISIRIGNNAAPMSLEEQQQLQASFLDPHLMGTETSLVTSYRIITYRHKGMLKVRTRTNPEDVLEEGINTEFEMLIPLR